MIIKVIFKMDQQKTKVNVFSRRNLQDLVLSYMSVSVSISTNVILAYLIARHLSTSECEW
jgi:hypothetical protein